MFIGLAAWFLAAIRRHAGARLFVWLGAWSALYGIRLLIASPAVLAALPQWTQASVPFLEMAIPYLLLPVASLAWLELSVGKVRRFLQAVIFLSLAIGIAGVFFFFITGSPDRLILYNNLLAATALLVLIVVVTVPKLSRKFLVLPNRAVVVIGTLAFALEALYFNVCRAFHYPTAPITGSLGLAILLFSFGYIAMQVAMTNERRLLAIENELAIAREIQASILPADNPLLPSLRVAAAYRPMTAVAGDFYDFILVDPHHIGFFVADVTGHGVPAALVAAMIKVALQSLASSASDPRQLMCGLNRILSAQLRARLVSAAYLFLDTQNAVALYSAAGHPPLLHCSEGNLQRIENNGLLLGVLPDSDYPLCDIPIHPGDRFLLYTDGVSESENANGDFFGEHQLEQVVRKNRPLPPSELLDQLVSEIRRWQPASASQHDDITIIAIDVLASH